MNFSELMLMSGSKKVAILADTNKFFTVITSSEVIEYF